MNSKTPRALFCLCLAACDASSEGGAARADAGGAGQADTGHTDAGPPVGPPASTPPAGPLAQSPPDWPLVTGPAGQTPRAVPLPPAGAPLDALRVSAARGEHETVWLSLGAGEGTVTATFTAPNTLGATVYGAGFTNGFADALTPLGPADPWPLTPQAPGALLLDVEVPRDAAPGDHNATLTLVRSNGTRVEVPVVIHVFDFELPREMLFSSQVNLSIESLIPPGGTVEDARNLLFDLHLTPASAVWPSGFRWDITWDSAANPQRCGAFWDEATEDPQYAVGALARRLLLGEGWNGVGFGDAELFQFVDNTTPRPDTFCGEARGDAFGTPAYNAAWGAWLTALTDYLRGAGLLDRTYAYLQNEPQTADDARLAAHLCRLVRAAAPGLRIAISEQPTPAIAEDAGGPCGYDIWIASLGHLQPAYALERQRDHGEQLWLYSLDHDAEPFFNPTAPDRDALHARVIPWVSWRLRARGWAYYDAGRFFPGGRPSVRALALRDGFEDYAYLYLANGGRHPAPGVEESLDRAVAPVATALTDWNRDPAVLAGVREALGAYLGGERDTLPGPPAADPDAPVESRYVNLQDPAGEPAADPLVVDGHTWEKAGWAPWDAERRLGFVGEHVADPEIAKTGYDAVDGVSETQRSYVYDDFGRPALFELGLAPGRYHVRVGLGRPARGYPGDPHNLSLEGAPVVVDHITTDAAPTFIYDGEVEVLDGRLSVAFGGRSAVTGEFAYTFLAFVSAEGVGTAP
jgi:hypothetical protein